MIDEFLIYNSVITEEQIAEIHSNGYITIQDEETTLGDDWQACITPNDGTEDGTEKCSNTITIIIGWAKQLIYDDGVKVKIYDDGVKNKEYD